MVIVAIVLLMAACGATARAATPTAAEQVRRLGRGVNVLGYDPLWNDPAAARFQPRHYARIRAGGFATLRVNLQAFAHMDGANRLDPRWLDTLDAVIRQAGAAGLMVILDEHDFIPCAADAALCRTRLLAFWTQVAARYRDAPDSVLFEILNEPYGQLTPSVWNRLLADALAVIRRDNPTRTVIIDTADAASIGQLGRLVLPDADRDIIVTVHYYEPIAFTHQGADWTVPSRVGMTGVTWGTPAERARVGRDLDTVAAWGRLHDRPILLGEFGAYDQGDMASRAAWTATVARDAEARGMAWCYWQFDSNFLAFDMTRDDWVAPIHDALVPP
jgi:endoglucanase